jgi:hypothetical protein
MSFKGLKSVEYNVGIREVLLRIIFRSDEIQALFNYIEQELVRLANMEESHRLNELVKTNLIAFIRGLRTLKTCKYLHQDHRNTLATGTIFFGFVWVH